MQSVPGNGGREEGNAVKSRPEECEIRSSGPCQWESQDSVVRCDFLPCLPLCQHRLKERRAPGDTHCFCVLHSCLTNTLVYGDVLGCSENQQNQHVLEHFVMLCSQFKPVSLLHSVT